LNHFAKDLGLPRELGAAMDVIAAGNATMIDVGEVNGRVFLNNSSIGVYPFFVAERTTEQRRSGASKLAAIGPALARTFKAASWQSVQIAAEGTREELRTPCVFVGNNFYDAADFGRRKSLSSGDLCIYLVRKQSWLGLMVLPLKIALGLVDTARDVELIQAKTLEIASRHRDVIVSLDGEAVEMTMPLRFRIRPRAPLAAARAARLAGSGPGAWRRDRGGAARPSGGRVGDPVSRGPGHRQSRARAR